MSDFTVTISITLEAANDPVFEPTPPKPSGDEPRCCLFSECNDPLCFRAGCVNDIFSTSREKKS